MIAINKGLLGADGLPTSALLLALMNAQDDICKKRLNRLHNYYTLNHDITGRTRLAGVPNNKLQHDLPGYIVTVASGYLVGKPVQYAIADGADKTAFDALKAALDKSDTSSVDAELAVDASVYGKGIELCYADEQAQPKVAQIDPRTSFVVYDDTVEHKPLLGIAIYPELDASLMRKGDRVDVYTSNMVVHYTRMSTGAPIENANGRESHYFGAVPMIEYWNNAHETGDFEPVVTLIDAYDVLQSDRVNDKQQFTDAVMVFKGMGSLSQQDDGEPDTTTTVNTDGPISVTTEEVTDADRLRQKKMVFLPDPGSDMSYVTKPDDQSGNELLRKSIAGDIHKFAYVPDLTDENFSGTTSGVAMRYKLFGLEMLVSTKERWFKEALRTRLKCLINFLSTKGNAALDVDTIQITFTRSLPVNELEIAQMAQAYEGILPDEMILSKIPGVDDPKATAEMLKKQKAEAVKNAQEQFPRYDEGQNKEDV
jgi:SPP1 family phage portal protein